MPDGADSQERGYGEIEGLMGLVWHLTGADSQLGKVMNESILKEKVDPQEEPSLVCMSR